MQITLITLVYGIYPNNGFPGRTTVAGLAVGGTGVAGWLAVSLEMHLRYFLTIFNYSYFIFLPFSLMGRKMQLMCIQDFTLCDL